MVENLLESRQKRSLHKMGQRDPYENSIYILGVSIFGKTGALKFGKMGVHRRETGRKKKTTASLFFCFTGSNGVHVQTYECVHAQLGIQARYSYG